MAQARIPVTRKGITEGIIALGAKRDDVLFIRCNLAATGVRRRDAASTFIGGIWDAIGPNGTILTPAFVQQGFRFGHVPLSTPETPPYTGAFSKLMLAQPGAYRSAHPTHSFVGLGARAEDILKHHPADGACFEPMRRMIEHDALFTAIGCVHSSPGVGPFHLIQYDMGLSQRHYTKLFWTVRLPDGRLFHKKEDPGCSDGAANFYELHDRAGNLKTATIGTALGVAARARAAYAIERAALEQDPRFFVCKRIDCLSCRTLRGYNKRAIPGALLHRVKRLILRW